MKLKNTAIFGFRDEEQFNRLKELLNWPSVAPFGRFEMMFTNNYETDVLVYFGSQTMLPPNWQKIHADTVEVILVCELFDSSLYA